MLVPGSLCKCGIPYFEETCKRNHAVAFLFWVGSWVDDFRVSLFNREWRNGSPE